MLKIKLTSQSGQVLASYFYAMQFHLRILWFERFVIIGLWLSLLLVSNWWLPNRSYPLISLLGAFHPGPYILTALVAILQLLLFLRLCFSAIKYHLVAILAVMLGIVLVDFTALQPWFYLYFWLFVAFEFYEKRFIYYADYHKFLGVFQFILVMVYFWAGIFKINPEFKAQVVPYFAYPVALQLNQEHTAWLYNVFSAIPFVEILIALGLVFTRTRLFSVLVATGLHLYIVAINIWLPPALQNWVILPWNISMIAGLWLLFTRVPDLKSSFVVTTKLAFMKLAIAVFVVVPMFNFFGWLDPYMAFEVYSGKRKFKEVCMPILKNEIGQSSYAYQSGQEQCLDYYKWSYEQNKMPPPDNLLYHKLLASKIGQKP